MAPPLVTIYVTSLTSAPKVRKHTELLHRALRGLEIPYEAYDLVNDEAAKRRWQRAKPEGMVIGLPGYLVGGEWVGTMDDFEEAVETQTLEKFLKQDMELADASQTIGEAELDRLMREMTDEDLDQLVGDLSVNDELPPDLESSATSEPASSGGLFAKASAAVASATSAVSDAVHKAEESIAAAAEEPASVSAKREEVLAEEAGSPPKKEQTLDDLIDKTLAKEAVDEEQKEAQVAEAKETAKKDIKEKVDALKSDSKP